MGDTLSCCLDRDKYSKIRYITKEQFQNDSVRYYALDCSVYSQESFGIFIKAGQRRINDTFEFKVDKLLGQKEKDNQKQQQKITLPGIYSISKHLKKLEIGKETPVMCYDLSDGKLAARVACMLCSIGVRNVTVLDGQNWDPKSETKETDSKILGGSEFEFNSKLDYFAQEDDLHEIVKELIPSAYIVDVRSKEERENQVFISTYKYIEVSDFFKGGKLVEKEQLLKVFDKAGIPKDTPLIFIGGDDAYVLKAITDHAAFKQKTQVFEKSYEEWIAWNKNQEKLNLKPVGAAEQQFKD